MQTLKITTSLTKMPHARVELDGKDISNAISGLTLRIEPQEIPQVTLDLVTSPIVFEGNVMVTPQPDETLVLNTDRDIDTNELERLQHTLSERFPLNRTVVLGKGMTLSVMQRASPEVVATERWLGLISLVTKNHVRLFRDENDGDYVVDIAGQCYFGRSLDIAFMRACAAEGL